VSETLWWCGGLPATGALRIALIGSRRAGPEQLALAQTLATTLSHLGAVVVSGGAVGIDSVALRAAVAAGGRPLAVLPCGLERPYPPENADLYQEIAERDGGLCSALDLTTPARTAAFLARNTLMTCLVDAVIAVCAGARSGSLHCAAQAWQAGLPVLAAPWSPGSPCSEGSNGLLAAGARAIHDAAGCAQLLTALGFDRGRGLLARDTSVPGRGTREPGGATRPGGARKPGPPPLPGLVEAAGGSWPCALPAGPPTASELCVPPGCDALLIQGLALALAEAGEAGLSLEELAHATQTDRGQVANAVLQCVLGQGLRRLPGGRYSLPGVPSAVVVERRPGRRAPPALGNKL